MKISWPTLSLNCRPLYLLAATSLIGCSSLYSHLKKESGDPRCLNAFRPILGSARYATRVDVTGKHLQGVISIRRLPDSSLRIDFSNSLGVKFFDFGFSRDSGFRVIYIMKQMDKQPVITTLRKDFELVLMDSLGKPSYIIQDSNLRYYAYPQEKGVNYYITNTGCDSLVRLQRASKKKVVVEAIMRGWRKGLPDTIGISHLNFQFDIGLKRILP